MALPLLLSLLLLPARSQGRPITLEEAFGLTLKRSETLAQQSETAAEAMARVDELWAAVQPVVSLQASEFYQDYGRSGTVSNSTRRDKPAASVTVHQPVFTGLREFLAVRAAKRQGRSAELDAARAEQVLYSDVAAAYLGLLAVQHEISIRQGLVEITSDRVRELKDRERIGRSRKSEVLAAESQVAQNEADLEGSRRNERSSQEALRFLTGLSEDLTPADILPAEADAALEDCLRRSRERPDVRAREQDLEAARFATQIAGRGRWPTVAFDGNAYLKRIGSQSDERWDLTVSASLPLFEGGKISAQTRQATHRQNKAGEAFSLARRKAETETRTAFRSLEAGLAVVSAREKAVTLAEANAKAQAADYRNGLVTNLDVLGALNTLQQVRLQLETARVDAALAKARLRVATGTVRP
ncbi:MAG: TolC family protein [Elusimicrobiota bacterium]